MEFNKINSNSMYNYCTETLTRQYYTLSESTVRMFVETLQSDITYSKECPSY